MRELRNDRLFHLQILRRVRKANGPMRMNRPSSALDMPCRGCGAKPGQKCGIVPDRSLLRRRIRAGLPVTAHWMKLLPYFHVMRERDFRRVRTEWNKLDDWQKRYVAEAS